MSELNEMLGLVEAPTDYDHFNRSIMTDKERVEFPFLAKKRSVGLSPEEDDTTLGLYAGLLAIYEVLGDEYLFDSITEPSIQNIDPSNFELDQLPEMEGLEETSEEWRLGVTMAFVAVKNLAIPRNEVYSEDEDEEAQDLFEQFATNQTEDVEEERLPEDDAPDPARAVRGTGSGSQSTAFSLLQSLTEMGVFEDVAIRLRGHHFEVQALVPGPVLPDAMASMVSYFHQFPNTGFWGDASGGIRISVTI